MRKNSISWSKIISTSWKSEFRSHEIRPPDPEPVFKQTDYRSETIFVPSNVGGELTTLQKPNRMIRIKTSRTPDSPFIKSPKFTLESDSDGWSAESQVFGEKFRSKFWVRTLVQFRWSQFQQYLEMWPSAPKWLKFLMNRFFLQIYLFIYQSICDSLADKSKV